MCRLRYCDRRVFDAHTTTMKPHSISRRANQHSFRFRTRHFVSVWCLYRRLYVFPLAPPPMILFIVSSSVGPAYRSGGRKKKKWDRKEHPTPSGESHHFTEEEEEEHESIRHAPVRSIRCDAAIKFACDFLFVLWACRHEDQLLPRSPSIPITATLFLSPLVKNVF